MQGLRQEMEDRCTLLPHPHFTPSHLPLPSPTPPTPSSHPPSLILSPPPPRSYFAIFDGHGGDVSAEYCRQHVHLNFLSDPHFASHPGAALARALMRTDTDFCSACRRINLLTSSGTTALCVYIQARTLVVANVGDSRAVLVKRSAASAGGGVVALSSDHKPGRKDEKARIEALGGRVAVSEEDAWGGGPPPLCAFLSACFPSTRPLRVFPGGLSVSRTIGDIAQKSTRLITAEAEVWEGEVGVDDVCVVLACDGVWDVMSNAMVADAVRRWEAGGWVGGCNGLAEAVAKEAFRKGSTDNISVVVVKFDWDVEGDGGGEAGGEEEEEKEGVASAEAAGKKQPGKRK